jgi:hypothetical protein
VRPGRSFAVGVLALLAAAPARADEKLDKKLFLLERALKNGDCGQALSVANTLVSEFPAAPAAQLSLAKSHLCAGDPVRAFDAWARFGALGGRPADGADVRAQILERAAIVTVRLDPDVGWLPPGAVEQFTYSVDKRVVGRFEGGQTAQLALSPGAHSLSVAHPALPGAPWLQDVAAQPGLELELVARPKPEVGVVVVRVDPPEAAEALTLTVRATPEPVAPLFACADHWGAGRPAVCAAKGDKLLLVARGSAVAVEGVPSGPTVERAAAQVVATDARHELTLKVKRRAPAQLLVGPFELPVEYTFSLPHADVAVRPGASIAASAGAIGWAMKPTGGDAWRGAEALTGSFVAPAGESAAPLPRGVIFAGFGQQQAVLVAPSVGPEPAVVQAPVLVDGGQPPDGHRTMAMRVPNLAPGELRSVKLEGLSIPAVDAWRSAQRAVKAEPRMRALTITSAGLGAVAGVVAGGSLLRAQQYAEAARGLESVDSAGQVEYDELVAKGQRLLKVTQVSAGVSLTGLLGAGGFGWGWIRSKPKAAAAMQRYDEARSVPFELGDASAPSSAD